MPAFAWSSRFREGQWLAFRRFMLEERRDATARFSVIDAERERIGSVRILWALDENRKPTEQRIGISVTPEDSSLAKLFAAYTALGGNPFDISMFTAPDRGIQTADGTAPRDPGGGLVHQKNVVYAYDQGVGDGDTNIKKYRASRMGGKRLANKEFEIQAITQRGRKWISQEIHFKRTRIEHLIIKLCDLREQLDEEVEDLLWATYGDMVSDSVYDSERFNDSLTAANVAYFFDSTFRIPDEEGRVEYDNEASSGQPGAVNIPVLSGFDSLMSDDEDESNTGF